MLGILVAAFVYGLMRFVPIDAEWFFILGIAGHISLLMIPYKGSLDPRVLRYAAIHLLLLLLSVLHICTPQLSLLIGIALYARRCNCGNFLIFTALSEISPATSLVDFVASTVNWLTPEQVEFSTLALLASLISGRKSVPSLAATSCVAILLSYTAELIGLSWTTQTLPLALGFGSFLLLTRTNFTQGQSLEKKETLRVGILGAALVLVWATFPPWTVKNLSVLLPENGSDAFESKFFENYQSALNFSGIAGRVINDLSQAPEGSTVIFPWVTSPLPNEDYIKRAIGSRALHLIFIGEHTNVGGVRDRINLLTSRTVLADDLTVPMGNTDHIGVSKGTQLLPIQPKAIFNRGASVTTKISDRVFLRGRAWWTEPNRNVWMWLGDYTWERGDRRGSIPLGTTFQIKKSRISVLGDNSPFVAQQLIANPLGAKRLVLAASGYPQLLSDALLFALIIFVSLNLKTLSLLTVAILLSIATVITTLENGGVWRFANLGQSGFDPRNFNEKLHKIPDLTNHFIVKRESGLITGSYKSIANRQVTFITVENTLEIDGQLTLSDCKRLGSIWSNDSKAYLMDAQSCRAVGNAKTVIGNDGFGSIFLVDSGARKHILILDKKFLSADAPDINVDFMKRLLVELE